MGEGLEIVVDFEHRMEFAPMKRPLSKSASHLRLIVLGESIHPLLFLVLISLHIPWAIDLLEDATGSRPLPPGERSIPP